MPKMRTSGEGGKRTSVRNMDSIADDWWNEDRRDLFRSVEAVASDAPNVERHRLRAIRASSVAVPLGERVDTAAKPNHAKSDGLSGPERVRRCKALVEKLRAKAPLCL